MRRKDRERTKEFALDVTDKCEWAVLSMVDLEGLPYAIPVSIVRDEENIYFHTAKAGTKIDILNQNPDVCLVCVGDTEPQTDRFTTLYQSAVIKGRASEVVEDAEKIHALRILCERHTPANMDAFDDAIAKSLKATGVWKIHIEDITGKGKL